MKTLLFSLLFLTSTLASASSIKAYYEVPTTDDLKEFAQYPIRCQPNTYNANPNSMTFSLPKELVGHLKPFKMARSKENPDVWVGDKVTGSCAQEDRNLRCEVRFNNLEIDIEEVHGILKDSFSDSAELRAKLKIADQFAREGEPIGFIVYKLRDHDRY